MKPSDKMEKLNFKSDKYKELALNIKLDETKNTHFNSK